MPHILPNDLPYFSPTPNSNAYIGPPSIVPSFVLTLYFTASNASPYFVAIPTTPVSQHHNTAPGPPTATAVATPTIFPVPIVAASAVVSAPNWLISPSAEVSFVTESLIALKICVCITLVLIVKRTCVPNNNINITGPHTQPFTMLT